MIPSINYLAQGFFDYIRAVLRSRRLILELTRREFRSRYLGSAFGLMWAFIQPAVMMAIYFVVFQYGLKAGPVNGVPFFVYLMSGLVPWFLASDIMSTGSSVILDNRFLVKKVVFRVSLLPVVRLLTFLPVHLFFVLALGIIFWTEGYRPAWQTLQIFYYLPALMIIGLGWTWLVSAMMPFFRDLGQFIQVVLQILFFAMPLIWPISNLSDQHQILMYLNPLYYIIGGYRDAMVEHVWFWQHPLATIYFWAWAIALLGVGGTVFLRMQQHFADVL